MSNTGFGTVSRRIRAEKALKHLGTARIEVDTLCFPESDGPNIENVKRLSSLFRLQRDLDPGELQNRIPAVIDESDLREALSASGLSQDSLLTNGRDYPTLHFRRNFRLNCLRGEDRVEAVKQVFRSSDVRWVVDLFAADISNEAKRDIVEEYASERKLDDGEVYYKIREYQGIFGQEQPHFEQRWLARLATLPDSKTKKECFDQLTGHPKFSRVFDAFHPIPALYCGLRLSSISKMISMRCHEELIAYLRHVKNFWYDDIFDGNEAAMKRLDKQSVRALELKAPGACQKDARGLYGRVHGGEILSAFSQSERELIWSKICSATAERLIPSLRGFFDDINYIKLAADCMKRLVSLNSEKTIRVELDAAYSEADQSSGGFLVQVSGQSTKLVQGSGSNHFDILYRQLWLYALREHPAMPANVNAKKSGGKTTQVDEDVLFRFVHFARKLGFKTDEITALLKNNPDRAIARRLLTTARKPEQFDYEDMESCITAVAEVIASAQPIANDKTEEYHIIEGHGKPPERSGQPLKNDLARDKEFMYLDVFHGAFPRHNPNLSSLFVQRSMYFALFGTDINLSVNDINAAPEVPKAVYGGQAFEQRTNPRLIQLSAEQRQVEEGYQRQLEDLRGKVAETESRLELLAQKEHERLNNVELLQSTLATQERTLDAARYEDQELRGRLEGIRQAEAEQVIRLETLQNDVQDRQSQIGELEKRRTGLSGEIRLALVATNRQNQSVQEEDHEARLLELSEQAIEKQNNVNQLAALNREKQQEMQLLEEEGQRLQLLVDELTAKRNDEDARAATMAAEERERNSVVDKLKEKELQLRQTIDQLDSCLHRLRTKINDATEDEKELQSRIEHLKEMERTAEIASRREHDRGEEPAVERPQIENSTLGAMVRRALNTDEESLRGEFNDHGTVVGTELVQVPQEPLGLGIVRIQFKLFENGDWAVKDEVIVDPTEPSAVMRLAKKYMRKEYGLFDSNSKALLPETCYQRVTSDGTNTIHLIPKWTGDGKALTEEVEIRKRNKNN